LPRHVVAEEQLDHEDDRDQDDDDERGAVQRAPEPRAAAVEDVLLAHLDVVAAEEARPRQEAPEDEIERAAECEGCAGGGDDRPADVHPGALVQPDEDRRCAEDGDEGGGAAEGAPVVSEDPVLLGRCEHRGPLARVGGAHLSSVTTVARKSRAPGPSFRLPPALLGGRCRPRCGGSLTRGGACPRARPWSPRRRPARARRRGRPRGRPHGGGGRIRDRRRVAGAPRRRGAHGLRRRRARARPRRRDGRLAAGARPLDIRVPAARDPRGASERPDAPPRRHLGVVRGGAATGFAAGGAWRHRADRCALRRGRKRARDGAARPCEPREPERPRRLPPRRHRRRRVRRDRRRRRPDPGHRLGPLRPAREPGRRRADDLGERRSPARVDADLHGGGAGGDRPRRGRPSDRRRAGRRRGARPPRVDGDERLPDALRARARRAGRRLPRRAPLARADARATLRARPHDAPGRPRPRAGRGAGRDPDLLRPAVGFCAVAELRGKTAIVTGASSGIGAATARALREAGATVAVGARRADRLEGDFAHELDVTELASCERFVAAAVEALGGGVDILFNNAGLALGRYPFWESTEEDELRVLRTNVEGTLRMTRLCLPHIRDGGHIVNIDSVAGRAAYENAAVYCAVKAAAAMFSQALREDLLGRPVRVTALAPGLTGGTEFSLVRFKGDEEKAAAVYQGVEPLGPEDIAECILFALTRPPHVNVDEIVVKALAQTSGGRILRNA